MPSTIVTMGANTIKAPVFRTMYRNDRHTRKQRKHFHIIISTRRNAKEVHDVVENISGPPGTVADKMVRKGLSENVKLEQKNVKIICG